MPVGVHSLAGRDMVLALTQSRQRLILRRNIARVGLRGEEVQVHSNVARHLLQLQQAVPVTLQSLQAVEVDGGILERTPEFLQQVQRQRQLFFDPFWAITATMLRFERRRFGPSRTLAVPLDRLDIANKLWETSKVKVQPGQVVFADGKQEAVADVGYHLVYVELEGGDGLEDVCYSTRFARLRMKVVTQNTRAMY
eukprot:EG_transcript_28843